MGNISRIGVSYFDSFAAELNGKFRRLRHLIENNQADGNYHEEVMRRVLRNFLSKRFSVKTGFIYKDDNSVSRQLDIMIVDENSPATYIFQEGEFAIVMPEAVVAVAEIKTTLNYKNFEGAVENIASAKRLFDNPNKHPGLVFGYQSSTGHTTNISDTKIDDWFQRDKSKKIKEESNAITPDAFFWLNDNYSLQHFNPDTNTIGDGHHHQYHSFNGLEDGNGWQLSIFLAIIVGACEDADFQRTRIFGNNLARKLLGMEELNVSDEIFELGVGKIKKES